MKITSKKVGLFNQMNPRLKSQFALYFGQAMWAIIVQTAPFLVVSTWGQGFAVKILLFSLERDHFHPIEHS